MGAFLFSEEHAVKMNNFVPNKPNLHEQYPGET